MGHSSFPIQKGAHNTSRSDTSDFCPNGGGQTTSGTPSLSSPGFNWSEKITLSFSAWKMPKRGSPQRGPMGLPCAAKMHGDKDIMNFLIAIPLRKLKSMQENGANGPSTKGIIDSLS
jgi:hypothetical protein